ncbi:MAG: acetyl esterase [Verrucomicrobiales bacterium]|nr:acetyl esterase [Verrucomicrobiales bacterium]
MHYFRGLPNFTPMKIFSFLLFLAATVAAHAVTNDICPAIFPDLRNVKYGPHDRNVLDLWQTKSTKPAPLLIYIHGGGWRGGDKSVIPACLLTFMLEHGVSVASINYRYSDNAKLPAPVHDAARAVQFLRSKAKEWHLNKNRFAATGASAGACTALWLAYHDDLADSKSNEPAARESSRLCAVVGVSGQTSIDPEVIGSWVGDQVMDHGMIWTAVGAKSRDELKLQPADYRTLFQEFSPINHVSRDDPPVMLLYPTPSPLPTSDPGTAIHHAMFGIKLKEKCNATGVTCELRFAKEPDQAALESCEFLLRHLSKGPNVPLRK